MNQGQDSFFILWLSFCLFVFCSEVLKLWEQSLEAMPVWLTVPVVVGFSGGWVREGGHVCLDG